MYNVCALSKPVHKTSYAYPGSRTYAAQLLLYCYYMYVFCSHLTAQNIL